VIKKKSIFIDLVASGYCHPGAKKVEIRDQASGLQTPDATSGKKRGVGACLRREASHRELRPYVRYLFDFWIGVFPIPLAIGLVSDEKSIQRKNKLFPRK